jgi:hypothetical protein
MAPDAREIAQWLEKYDHARKSFVHGFISRIEALDALRNLRFRDDALKVEILEWERAKARHATGKRTAARAKLKDFIDEPRGPTQPSSV